MSELSEFASSPQDTKVYGAVGEIPAGTAGLVEGQYVWKGTDSSRVFIFFCGAVNTKLIPMSPIFQRWKWVHKFSHSVIIAHDPLIKKTGSLQLAWYTGLQDGPGFDDIISVPLRLARTLSSGEICAFGSSGGGFAALKAAVHNHVDSAMAINPQTNILRYSPQLRDKFLRTYMQGSSGLNQTDHERLSITGALWRYYDNCRTHVVINTQDNAHFNGHVVPLYRVAQQQNLRSLSFSCYDDAKNGHNPPVEANSLWLVQKWWPDSIASEYRGELQGLRSLRQLERSDIMKNQPRKN